MNWRRLIGSFTAPTAARALGDHHHIPDLLRPGAKDLLQTGIEIAPIIPSNCGVGAPRPVRRGAKAKEPAGRGARKGRLEEHPWRRSPSATSERPSERLR